MVTIHCGPDHMFMLDPGNGPNLYVMFGLKKTAK